MHTDTTCPLVPMEDLLIIKRDEAKKETHGLHLPEETQGKRRPFTGEVIRVGPGERLAYSGIAPGDRVLYNRRADTAFLVGDEQLVVVNVRDILTKVETDAEVLYADGN